MLTINFLLFRKLLRKVRLSGRGKVAIFCGLEPDGDLPSSALILHVVGLWNAPRTPR